MQQRQGFHGRTGFRPGGFVMVVGIHAAALAALALVKTPEFIDKVTRTLVYDVPPPSVEPEPKPAPEPERTDPEPAEHLSKLEAPAPLVDLPLPGSAGSDEPAPPLPPLGQPGMRDLPPQPKAEPVPLPEPVRVEAQLDPRYADQLQPEYPASEQRAERDGRVSVRVTIGTDGRVRQIVKLSATSDAFWRATERHARARWRFRPATVDGRPVESEKVMNVYFRLED